MSSKRSPAEEKKQLHWSALPTFFGILAILALEQLTGIDIWLQNRLYDPATGWIVDPDAELPRFLLYRLPKMLLWLFGLLVLILAAGPERWRRRAGLLRRDLWVLFSILALVPLTVGAVKTLSRVPCPYELQCYGGTYPYVKLFTPYTAEERPAKYGRCFPAAQASAGFSLMGLLALGASRRRFRRAFLIGSAAGFFLGSYQMARGAHFLSHTLTSWLWAWLLALLVDHFWPRPAKAPPEEELV